MQEPFRYRLSASVFVIFARGADLLLLRRKGTGWMDGFYSLPAGGLEEGEAIRDAAVRQAEEEVRLRVDPDRLA